MEKAFYLSKEMGIDFNFNFFRNKKKNYDIYLKNEKNI